MHAPTLRLTLIALIALTTACQHIPRPSEKQSIIAQQTLHSPTDTLQKQGQLSLLGDGLWALLDPSFSPQKNTLILLESSYSSHLFVVTSLHDWGATLQRISHKAFNPQESFSITPISMQKLAWDTHDAQLCPSTKECKNLTNQHIAYPANTSNLTLIPSSKIRTDTYTLPITPAHNLPENTPFLAIKTADTTQQSHAFILLLDSACPQSMAEQLKLPHSIQTITHALKLTDKAHLAEVETLAIQHGADTIVACPSETKKVLIATPSLARPELPSGTSSIPSIGPLLLSATPLTIDASDTPPHVLSALIQGSGHAARGHFTLAAHLMEQAISAQPFSRQFDAIAHPLAQLIALENPEQALHIGWQATRQSWRRDEVLEQNILMIAVWAGLNQQNKITALETSLVPRAQSQRDSSLSPWIIWRALRQSIAQGTLESVADFQTLAPPFHNQKDTQYTWDTLTLLALLYTPNVAREDHLESLKNHLQSRAKEGDYSELILSSILPEHGLNTCAKQSAPASCLPDVYGKNLRSWASQQSSDSMAIQHLLTTPQRPPYLAKYVWWATLNQLKLSPWVKLAATLVTQSKQLSKFAMLLGQQQATTPSSKSTDYITQLNTYITHRDRNSHTQQEVILTALKTVTAQDETHVLNMLQTSMEEAQDKDKQTLFTYWEALISSTPTLAMQLDAWQALQNVLPKNADVNQCIRPLIAESTYLLATQQLSKAQNAYTRAEQCINEKNGELDAKLGLNLETIHAMLNLEERGMLPAKQSNLFTQQLESLTAQQPKHTTCPVIFEHTPPLEKMLSPDMYALYKNTTPDASNAQQDEFTLKQSTASLKKKIVQDTLTTVHKQLLKPGTPPEQLERTILAQLDEAITLSRQANSIHAVRRITFIKDILIQPSAQDNTSVLQAILQDPTILIENTPSKLIAPEQRAQIQLAQLFLKGATPKEITDNIQTLTITKPHPQAVQEMCRPTEDL